MPTIPQLPTVTSVNSDDELPLQQNGVTSSVTVGTLLSGTEPALTVPTGSLLGRASLGAGSPETIAIGSGLAFANATVSANIGTIAGTVAAGNDPRLTGALQSANNLSDLANAALARGNLGLGSLAAQNAAAVAISGGSVSATDLSNATAIASATTAARTLAARFADRLNVDDFGLARNGTTDDSVAFAAAVAAASAANKALHIPAGGPILLGGAAQITLQNVTLIGDGGTDFGYPYGRNGSQIWITGTAQSPFLIGAAVLIERLCFYYPNQFDQPGGPIVYPPLFLGMTGISAVADVVFADNQVTNAYDFFTVPAATTVGDVMFTRNRICALNVCFSLPNVADIIFMSDNFFSWGVFQDEMLHYGGGSAATVAVTLTLAVGVAAGSTTLPVSSVTNLVPGMPLSGNAAIPYNATIAGISGDTITITVPTLAALAGGATFQAIENSYYLRDYATTRSVWLLVSGNGSASAPSSTTNSGPISVGNFVFGYRTAILVDGGTLAGNFTETNFDSIGSVLRVINNGTLQTTHFENFSVYGYIAGDTSAPLPLFLIDNPAPNAVESASGANLMLTVANMEVGFSEGMIFDIRGDHVYEIRVTDSKLTRYAHNGVISPQPALRIDAPNARLSLIGNEILPQDGGVGVQISAILAATIVGNCFSGCNLPLDIETGAGFLTLAGNTSVGTNGASAIATSLLAASAVSVAGTATAGDVLTLTVSGSALIGGPVAASYTVASGDTAASATLGLANALTSAITIVPATILTTAPSGATTLTLYDASALAVGMVAYGNTAIPAATRITAISGNTVTLSAAITAEIAFNGAVTFASPLAVLSGSFAPASGVFVTVHPGTATLVLYAPGAAGLSFAATTSSGASETLTIAALATNAAGNIHDVGNGWDKPSYAYAPAQNGVVAGAVNGLRLFGAVSGAPAGLASAGSDAAVDLEVATQGNGILHFSANGNDVMRLVSTSGFANYLTLSPGSAGAPAGISSAGALGANGVTLAGAGDGAVSLGSAGASGSPVALLGARAEQSYSYQTPASGAAITVPNNCSLLQIAGSAALAALSVTLPAAPIDGQEVTLATLPAITALTLAANSGQTLAGAATAMPANSAIRFIFFATGSLWARLQ